MYKMSVLARRMWKMCRSLLHIAILVLSLPDLGSCQYPNLSKFGSELGRIDRIKNPSTQTSFQTVDSFGQSITVFNMTTISPPLDETNTKVTVETFDAILGALDNAAQTIEDAQISTADFWQQTTHHEQVTVVPPPATQQEGGGGEQGQGQRPASGSQSNSHSSNNQGDDNSEKHDSESDYDYVEEPQTGIQFPTIPPGLLNGPNGGEEDVAVNPSDVLNEFGKPPFFKPPTTGTTSSFLPELTTTASPTTYPSFTTTATPTETTSSTTEPFYDDFEVIEDIGENDVVSIVAVNDGSGRNATVIETKVFHMTSHRSDLDTQFTFNRLSTGATQLHCTVITKNSALFFDDTGKGLDVEFLPTVYLVDNRTNCKTLVEEGGEVYVKFIGAIRFAGIVVADISDILHFDELEGRCIAVLIKNQIVNVDFEATTVLPQDEFVPAVAPLPGELAMSSTSAVTASTTTLFVPEVPNVPGFQEETLPTDFTFPTEPSGDYDGGGEEGGMPEIPAVLPGVGGVLDGGGSVVLPAPLGEDNRPPFPQNEDGEILQMLPSGEGLPQNVGGGTSGGVEEEPPDNEIFPFFPTGDIDNPWIPVTLPTFEVPHEDDEDLIMPFPNEPDHVEGPDFVESGDGLVDGSDGESGQGSVSGPTTTETYWPSVTTPKPVQWETQDSQIGQGITLPWESSPPGVTEQQGSSVGPGYPTDSASSSSTVSLPNPWFPNNPDESSSTSGLDPGATNPIKPDPGLPSETNPGELPWTQGSSTGPTDVDQTVGQSTGQPESPIFPPWSQGPSPGPGQTDVTGQQPTDVDQTVGQSTGQPESPEAPIFPPWSQGPSPGPGQTDVTGQQPTDVDQTVGQSTGLPESPEAPIFPPWSQGPSPGSGPTDATGQQPIDQGSSSQSSGSVDTQPPFQGPTDVGSTQGLGPTGSGGVTSSQGMQDLSQGSATNEGFFTPPSTVAGSKPVDFDLEGGFFGDVQQITNPQDVIPEVSQTGIISGIDHSEIDNISPGIIFTKPDFGSSSTSAPPQSSNTFDLQQTVTSVSITIITDEPELQQSIPPSVIVPVETTHQGIIITAGTLSTSTTPNPVDQTSQLSTQSSTITSQDWFPIFSTSGPSNPWDESTSFPLFTIPTEEALPSEENFPLFTYPPEEPSSSSSVSQPTSTLPATDASPTATSSTTESSTTAFTTESSTTFSTTESSTTASTTESSTTSSTTESSSTTTSTTPASTASTTTGSTEPSTPFTISTPTTTDQTTTISTSTSSTTEQTTTLFTSTASTTMSPPSTVSTTIPSTASPTTIFTSSTTTVTTPTPTASTGTTPTTTTETTTTTASTSTTPTTSTETTTTTISTTTQTTTTPTTTTTLPSTTASTTTTLPSTTASTTITTTASISSTTSTDTTPTATASTTTLTTAATATTPTTTVSTTTMKTTTSLPPSITTTQSTTTSSPSPTTTQSTTSSTTSKATTTIGTTSVSTTKPASTASTTTLKPAVTTSTSTTKPTTASTMTFTTTTSTTTITTTSSTTTTTTKTTVATKPVVGGTSTSTTSKPTSTTKPSSVTTTSTTTTTKSTAKPAGGTLSTTKSTATPTKSTTTTKTPSLTVPTKSPTLSTTTVKTTTSDILSMPGDNTPVDITIDNESIADFDNIYDDTLDLINPPVSVQVVSDDPKMYFDQVTTTTVSPVLYDYLFNFGSSSKPHLKETKRKKFDAQSLKEAYGQILKKVETARRPRSHPRSRRQVVYSTLLRPVSHNRRVIGILDKRAPPQFRFNQFVLISLPAFSVASTGSTGAALVAVAAAAVATLSAPFVSLASSSGTSSGDLSFVSSALTSASSPATFWDRFSTWPLVKLSGVSGSSVWLVIFSVFFLYVAVILYSDGGLLLSGILRSLNISGALARNVRRNLSDEIRSNGIFRTVSWVWESIANWRVPKVKNPRSDPFNYYRNNSHKGYGVKPSPSKQKRQKTRRRPRPKQRLGPQTDSLQTQRNWNFKRRLRNDDTYYSAYVNSFYQ